MDILRVYRRRYNLLAKHSIKSRRSRLSHEHNWTEWDMKVKKNGGWVDRVTQYSPGGFWLERWWKRDCVRGSVIKHSETWTPNLFEENKHSEYPLDLDLLDRNNPRRVFIQASGSPFHNYG